MSGLTWLASYPKSGNTWVRVLLEHLRRPAGDAVDINRLDVVSRQLSQRRLLDDVLQCDSSELTHGERLGMRPYFLKALAADSRRHGIYKTHECWCLPDPNQPQMYEPGATAASIYLLRDPRDVAVSLAHHLGSSLDAAITFMADPGCVLGGDAVGFSPNHCQPLGSWSWHVVSWTRLARPLPTVVRYEDLHADPIEALQRICRALRWTVSTPDLRAALDGARLDRLQAEERRHGFAESRPGRQFFRQGIVGGWRAVLSPQQAGRLAAEHAEIMAAYGYR